MYGSPCHPGRAWQDLREDHDKTRVLYSGHQLPDVLGYALPLCRTENNEKFSSVSATRRADYDRTFAVEVVDKESNAVGRKTVQDSFQYRNHQGGQPPPMSK